MLASLQERFEDRYDPEMPYDLLEQISIVSLDEKCPPHFFSIPTTAGYYGTLETRARIRDPELRKMATVYPLWHIARGRHLPSSRV